MAASTSPSPQSTSAESLNFFARLPAELRLMVYGHLGYPVSKHLWIDCPGHPECQDNSHIVDHRDADWPISWHTHPGVFEIRISVKHVDIRMSNGEQRVILGPVGVRGVMKWVNGKETMIDAVAYMSTKLLAVNKEVRHEILSLLLSSYEIRFSTPLCGYEPEMVLQTSTFGYMTNVTLDRLDIYLGSSETSILFLAEHCPQLRYITLIAEATWLQDLGFARMIYGPRRSRPINDVGTVADVMGVVQALRVLTVQYEALVKVKLGSMKCSFGALVNNAFGVLDKDMTADGEG